MQLKLKKHILQWKHSCDNISNLLVYGWQSSNEKTATQHWNTIRIFTVKYTTWLKQDGSNIQCVNILTF